MDQGLREAPDGREVTIMPPAKLMREPGDPARADSGPDGVASPGATVEVPRIRPRDPVSKAVLAAFETALSRIRATDAAARRGDVEGIHRLRTTTRRLRSELRAFRDLLAPEWAGPIEAELKWLAGLLGDVGDRH
ncbi:MAG: CHAD domain-containing protein, partial [Isosphaeraceae bacterium]